MRGTALRGSALFCCHRGRPPNSVHPLPAAGRSAKARDSVLILYVKLVIVGQLRTREEKIKAHYYTNIYNMNKKNRFTFKELRSYVF